jgi:predicted SAM-dependent methyltransferase
MKRINVGCGSSPTPGWLNYDNSWTVWLAGKPMLRRLAYRLGFLNPQQRHFADVAHDAGILWADARNLPLGDHSVDVIYSSHTLEHMSVSEARRALSEFLRVLVSGGHLRIVLPDLRRLALEYIQDGDADAYMTRSRLGLAESEGMVHGLRAFLAGRRQHAWMYDSMSFVRILEKEGFTGVRVLSPGESTIPDPGELDLRERESESFFVEARKAGAPIPRDE